MSQVHLYSCHSRVLGSWLCPWLICLASPATAAFSTRSIATFFSTGSATMPLSISTGLATASTLTATSSAARRGGGSLVGRISLGRSTYSINAICAQSSLRLRETNCPLIQAGGRRHQIGVHARLHSYLRLRTYTYIFIALSMSPLSLSRIGLFLAVVWQLWRKTKTSIINTHTTI